MKLAKLIAAVYAALATCISISAGGQVVGASVNVAGIAGLFEMNNLYQLLANAPPGNRADNSEFGPGANYTVLPAASFTHLREDGTLLNGGYIVTCNVGGPTPFFTAPIQLPSGVRLTRIDTYGLDASPANDVIAGILQLCHPITDPTAPPVSLGVHTGSSPTPPGPFEAGANLSETIDNENCSYSVMVILNDAPGPCSGNTLYKARLTWQRQISPPPATASFNDVQTGDPFFREIEALYASGITGGCGGNNYCPDDPITRNQMAAYLARGLGL